MRVVGMMSGTSVDGIDVAIADITLLSHHAGSQAAFNPRALSSVLAIKQLAFTTVPWTTESRHKIFALIQEATTASALCEANFQVAYTFADVLLEVLAQEGIEHDSIDLIASHGQTIWHNVVDGHVTSTLQIGDPSVLAARTGITTVGNFRTADVAVGGQGAPLVSLYDWYFLRPTPNASISKEEALDKNDSSPSLSSAPAQWRAVQNIGGIGNVTFLPPLDHDGLPIAFDTGPGNLYIDWAAILATNGRTTYDKDGELAKAGHVSYDLLQHCLQLPYFHHVPPKSTGRELFDNTLVAEWWTIAQTLGLSELDFVATMTELTAITIAEAYQRFAPGVVSEVIVAGGGARNPVLLQAIEAQFRQNFNRVIPVRTHAQIGIDDKAKEALAFALMGYLTIHGKPGNVPSCTGARQEQILGQIAPGNNYSSLLHKIQER